jgi:RNA 3'-terminal phosphate cyclase-like protein
MRIPFENKLRQRILLSQLSGKPIKIQGIRPDDSQIGLRDYEVNFIRLMEKITNGTMIHINHTGTALEYIPGVLQGGTVVHQCNGRSIGYFLESLIILGPFCKQPLQVTLNGITNDNIDVTVDTIRTVLLPQLKRFGIEGVELKITKRGAYPKGGGQIEFSCPIVKQLKPMQHTEQGLFKRIRGIAYCTRMSPQMANRMVESCRSILTRYIPDVYIYTDVSKGPGSGLCPGYGMTLVAESESGSLISTECQYQPRMEEEGLHEYLVNDYQFPTPEDLGIRCARQLLIELKKGILNYLFRWLCRFYISVDESDLHFNGPRRYWENSRGVFESFYH